MSTPCCQSLRSNRLVVSEYEVPKVLVSQECQVYLGTPCSTNFLCKLSHPNSPSVIFLEDSRMIAYVQVLAPIGIG